MDPMTEEEQRTATLEWIPRPMRTRMDEAVVRISLAQWQALPLRDRRALADAALEPRITPRQFAGLLRLALGTADL
jgi:hypothetical protein